MLSDEYGLLSPYAIPAVGTTVLVTLPDPHGDGTPRRFRVVEARERVLTLNPEGQLGEPGPPAGTPCLVGAIASGRPRAQCEAVVVSAGALALVVDVAPDPRKHPRHQRPWKVKLEAPGTGIGVVEGTMEDISVGGMRAGTPVRLPVDARVFVTVLVDRSAPVLAIAEVRAAHARDDAEGFVARLQFTVMARWQYLRLAVLLAWASEEPGDAHGTPMSS